MQVPQYRLTVFPFTANTLQTSCLDFFSYRQYYFSVWSISRWNTKINMFSLVNIKIFPLVINMNLPTYLSQSRTWLSDWTELNIPLPKWISCQNLKFKISLTLLQKYVSQLLPLISSEQSFNSRKKWLAQGHSVDHGSSDTSRTKFFDTVLFPEKIVPFWT